MECSCQRPPNTVTQRDLCPLVRLVLDKDGQKHLMSAANMADPLLVDSRQQPHYTKLLHRRQRSPFTHSFAEYLRCLESEVNMAWDGLADSSMVWRQPWYEDSSMVWRQPVTYETEQSTQTSLKKSEAAQSLLFWKSREDNAELQTAGCQRKEVIKDRETSRTT